MSRTDHSLLTTPSSGKDEVRAALAHAHGQTRPQTAARLKRHFYTRVPTADITTVLDQLVIDADATGPDGDGAYLLTTAGKLKERDHPNPRFLPRVAT